MRRGLRPFIYFSCFALFFWLREFTAGTKGDKEVRDFLSLQGIGLPTEPRVADVELILTYFIFKFKLNLIQISIAFTQRTLT